MRRTLSAIAIALAIAGPASLAAQGSAAPAERNSRDLITKEQMSELRVNTAYEVLETLRPAWLRDRGPTSFATKVATTRADSLTGAIPIVYMDNTKLGPVEELKKVPVRDIFSIRHLSGTEAQARYGVGHSAGVILISTGPGTAAPEEH